MQLQKESLKKPGLPGLQTNLMTSSQLAC